METKPPALSLDAQSVKTQRRITSTLKAEPLARWIGQQEVIAAAVQLRLTDHPSQPVRVELARHPSILRRTQHALFEQGVAIRWKLAGNPGLHPEVKERLFAEPGRYCRAGLTANPALTPVDIERLLGDDDSSTRHRVAGRADLSDDLKWRIFKGADDMGARGGLLRLNKLPAGMFETIVKGVDASAMTMIAANRHLSAKEAMELRKLHVGEVDEVLARRSDLTEEMVESLLGSTSHQALVNLALRAPLTEKQLWKLLGMGMSIPEGLCLRSDLPAKAIEKMISGDYGDQVRTWIARNPILSAKQLEGFYSNADTRILRSLAANTSLPEWIQDELAHSDDSGLLDALRRNTKLKFKASWPLKFLLSAPRWRIEFDLREGIEPAAWEALASSWEGTLTELRETAALFSESD